MLRSILFTLSLCAFVGPASAQSMYLSISSDDFQVMNVFSDVDTFRIDIEIDQPLAAGSYVNPDIVAVDYAVSGDLVAGTPSEFPSFALRRQMSGDEFYAQGSSLVFEIDQAAVLDDGVQVTELVGNSVVLTFNGREIGNGRFHPALLELDADGSGRLQNSNNIVSEDPFESVQFGDEYITDLMFDPGNTTVLSDTAPDPVVESSGGGSVSGLSVLLLVGFFGSALIRRKV